MPKNIDYNKVKQALIENGTNPKAAEYEVKTFQLIDEVDDRIEHIRSLPDDSWKSSDSWYELVLSCCKYKLHHNKLYSKNGPYDSLTAE